MFHTKDGNLPRGVMEVHWGRGQVVFYEKAKELWKTHCKSCYFSYNMFQTQTNSKKVCVRKQTLNHFVNPALDFTFLQWGSHSFIQIPKVEIICSKCFQSRPVEGPNDFSRAGENCEIVYTLMEHSRWKKRDKREEGERNVLVIYLFILLQWWLFVQFWGRCVDCQSYFLWQVTVSPILRGRLWQRPWSIICVL